MKSMNNRQNLKLQHLILFAVSLVVSIQDTQASEMDVVKKFSDSNSVVKVVFSEPGPSDIRHVSNVIERIAKTFDAGDQIEVTMMNEASDPSDSGSSQRLQKWELESNHASRQRNLLRERLSRASEEIERGNLTANSKYYRDLLNSYKEIDEKYKHALEQLKRHREMKNQPIKKVFTVQSTDQILKEIKPDTEGRRHILLIRRISVKDLTRGAAGFAVAVGAMAPVVAAEITKENVETRPQVVQPKPFQSTGGVN